MSAGSSIFSRARYRHVHLATALAGLGAIVLGTLAFGVSPAGASGSGVANPGGTAGPDATVLRIISMAEDNHGDIAPANGWKFFTAVDGNRDSFESQPDGVGRSVLTLPAGPATLSITEQVKPGYSLDYTRTGCHVDGVSQAYAQVADGIAVSVSAGASIACTFTNIRTERTGAGDPSESESTGAPEPPASSDPAGPPAQPKTAALMLTSFTSVARFGTAGTPFTITYRVKNVGDVSVHDVAVDDEAFVDGAVSCPQSTLDVEQSEYCTATDSVVAGDLEVGRINSFAVASAVSDEDGAAVSSQRFLLEIPGYGIADDGPTTDPVHVRPTDNSSSDEPIAPLRSAAPPSSNPTSLSAPEGSQWTSGVSRPVAGSAASTPARTGTAAAQGSDDARAQTSAALVASDTAVSFGVDPQSVGRSVQAPVRAPVQIAARQESAAGHGNGGRLILVCAAVAVAALVAGSRLWSRRLRRH